MRTVEVSYYNKCRKDTPEGSGGNRKTPHEDDGIINEPVMY